MKSKLCPGCTYYMPAQDACRRKRGCLFIPAIFRVMKILGAA